LLDPLPCCLRQGGTSGSYCHDVDFAMFQVAWSAAMELLHNRGMACMRVLVCLLSLLDSATEVRKSSPNADVLANCLGPAVDVPVLQMFFSAAMELWHPRVLNSQKGDSSARVATKCKRSRIGGTKSREALAYYFWNLLYKTWDAWYILYWERRARIFYLWKILTQTWDARHHLQQHSSYLSLDRAHLDSIPELEVF
jgi:hypothetical protein